MAYDWKKAVKELNPEWFPRGQVGDLKQAGNQGLRNLPGDVVSLPNTVLEMFNPSPMRDFEGYKSPSVKMREGIGRNITGADPHYFDAPERLPLEKGTYLGANMADILVPFGLVPKVGKGLKSGYEAAVNIPHNPKVRNTWGGVKEVTGAFGEGYSSEVKKGPLLAQKDDFPKMVRDAAPMTRRKFSKGMAATAAAASVPVAAMKVADSMVPKTAEVATKTAAKTAEAPAINTKMYEALLDVRKGADDIRKEEFALYTRQKELEKARQDLFDKTYRDMENEGMLRSMDDPEFDGIEDYHRDFVGERLADENEFYVNDAMESLDEFKLIDKEQNEIANRLKEIEKLSKGFSDDYYGMRKAVSKEQAKYKPMTEKANKDEMANWLQAKLDNIDDQIESNSVSTKNFRDGNIATTDGHLGRQRNRIEHLQRQLDYGFRGSKAGNSSDAALDDIAEIVQGGFKRAGDNQAVDMLHHLSRQKQGRVYDKIQAGKSLDVNEFSGIMDDLRRSISDYGGNKGDWTYAQKLKKKVSDGFKASDFGSNPLPASAVKAQQKLAALRKEQFEILGNIDIRQLLASAKGNKRDTYHIRDLVYELNNKTTHSMNTAESFFRSSRDISKSEMAFRKAQYETAKVQHEVAQKWMKQMDADNVPF